MSIGARVIRPVALQEIDDAPHAQTSAQGHNEGLQGGDSGRKELHINLHILRECYPGLVATNFISFVSTQAWKLIHSVVAPPPTKSTILREP